MKNILILRRYQKPYLEDIKNNIKKYDTWKTQLTLSIKFMSSKDTDEELLIHSRNDNIEIMINNKADEDILNHCFTDIKSA